MPLLFQVVNAGKAAVTLQLLGREPTADFEVRDARGELVWSLLHGQTMLGALRLYELRAGQQLRFAHSWNQHKQRGGPVDLGEYSVRGVLLTDVPGGLASAPFRFLIRR